MVSYKSIRKYFIAVLLVFAGVSYSNQKLGQSAKGFTTKVEGPYDYITQSDLNDMGLNNYDATTPFVRLGKNDYWIYLSEGGKEIPMHSSITRVRTTLSKIDKSSAEVVPIYGIPDAGINRFNGWKGWLMNLYEIDSDELLAIVHYEDQDNLVKPGMEDYRIGVAYSDDDGKSFKNLGFMLETEIDTSIIKSCGCTNGKCNIAGGGLRWDDTYLYVYFSDMNAPDKSDCHIAVARAKIAEVVKNARKGKNTVWYKYFNGKWDQPGMGGRSSSLGKLNEYHTNVMYNDYIDKWIIFNVQGNLIKMRTSSDPLNFDVSGEVICELPKGYRAAYCTVNSNRANMSTCGKEFYVYYRYYKKKEYNGARLKILFEKK